MHDRCTAMKGPDPEYPYILFSRGKDVVCGGGISLEQTWRKDANAIDRVKGRRIHLKFYMDNVDLFSFRSSGE